MSLSIEELHLFLPAVSNEWSKTTRGSKAKVESFLVPGAGFFPDELVIPRSIVMIEDINIIEKNLYEGVNNGYSMGIRTIADRPIFGGGKLDWALEIDTEDKVSDFLENILPKWQAKAKLKNYKIDQLVLMNNLPEIGTVNERPNQFVFRIAWNSWNSLSSLRSQLLMEMATGTNKLRVLDQKMEKDNCDTIRYQCLYRETGFLENTELQIGKNIVNSTDISTVISVISQLNCLIKDPEIQFIKRLDFFSDLGLNIIEFQGYSCKDNRLIKMLIYGLRGIKDETLMEFCF